jgi:hypothetical protein
MRFYLFASNFSGSTKDINASYAFCLEERPERIYWAVGKSNDAFSALFKAVGRVLEAVSTLDGEERVELITSQKNFESRLQFLLDREAERQRGYKVAWADQERERLRVAQHYRSLGVRFEFIRLVGDVRLFNLVKYEAQLQLARGEKIPGSDADFTRRDAFDLAEDLARIVMSRGLVWRQPLTA